VIASSGDFNRVAEEEIAVGRKFVKKKKKRA
jgi:hypothetical protein